MSYRTLLLAGAALATSSLTSFTPAGAAVIDRPHFKVLGVVVVWAANDADGSTPIASEFIIGDGSNTDLIAQDGRTVLTGSLVPTLDAAGIASAPAGRMLLTGIEVGDGDGDLDSADTFSAFDVTGQSLAGDALTYDSSFYVVSNTSFGINAEILSSTTNGDFTLADIGYSFSSTQSGTDGAVTFGSNANDVGSTGTFTAPPTLAGFGSGPNQVFEASQRTAAAAGTLVSQSVRFDAQYSLGPSTGYDLSVGAGEIEAELAYTFYVP